MKAIELKKINMSYGDTCVLDNITFDIEEKHITCIVGPSGCGKSTILNILSGRFKPDGGNIINLEGKKISYVFQKPRLIPWLSIVKNMEFVLGKTKEDNEKISYWLNLVELSGYEDAYPSKLSGGMEQRAALARAFMVQSELLLMDEPFKGLDEPLKLRMLNLVHRRWKESQKTIVFVTHDIREALLLGDKIIVLKEKPTKVLDEITIDIPHNERHIGCHRLGKIEESIYAMLEGDSMPSVKMRQNGLGQKLRLKEMSHI